jgi:5-methylcytosine-specific restriction endonuclease McrA
MKNQKLNAALVWKQLEDQLVPRLRLSPIERAVYYHLVRHSRLEGKRRLRFSIASLGRGTCLAKGTVRKAICRLAEQGALRLVRRTKTGHIVEVRVPDEIRAVRLGVATVSNHAGLPHAASLEGIDFMRTKPLRQAIYSRERGRCFYCLRRLAPTVRCIDHVVPRTQLGRNSYRNLVSACLECNSHKGEKRAEDFLRWLFREHQLGAADLNDRFRALELLASGKLRPSLRSQ